MSTFGSVFRVTTFGTPCSGAGARAAAVAACCLRRRRWPPERHRWPLGGGVLPACYGGPEMALRRSRAARSARCRCSEALNLNCVPCVAAQASRTARAWAASSMAVRRTLPPAAAARRSLTAATAVRRGGHSRRRLCSLSRRHCVATQPLKLTRMCGWLSVSQCPPASRSRRPTSSRSSRAAARGSRCSPRRATRPTR